MFEAFVHHQVLQARGKVFHPGCFCCVVCRRGLVDQPFAVDSDCRIYCVSDYHRWNYKSFNSLCKKKTEGESLTPAPGQKPHLVSLRLSLGFRVQAPLCGACMRPILPTEVSFNNTNPLDVKSEEFHSSLFFSDVSGIHGVDSCADI